jgi:dihydroorotate dehydrogenase
MSFNGKIGHLEDIESPWSNAAGVARSIDEVYQLAQTGVGTIEVGGYTLERQLGGEWNQETGEPTNSVYFHDPDRGLTLNAIQLKNNGFNGDREAGFEPVVGHIPEMAKIAHGYDKKLIVNVALVSEDPVTESQELVRRAYGAGADAVLLSPGCPKYHPEQLLSRDIKTMKLILEGLKKEVEKNHPIFLRVSPMRNHRLRALARAVVDSGVVSAVYTTNTWHFDEVLEVEDPVRRKIKSPHGGVSGPAMANKGLVETAMWVTELNHLPMRHRPDVVRTIGITNAYELERSLFSGIGAVAGAGTTFFTEPRNGWAADVDKLLHDLAA